MTLVECESCGQPVIRMFVAQTGPDAGRWRILRHKFRTRLGQQELVDWCPGRYERREGP